MTEKQLKNHLRMLTASRSKCRSIAESIVLDRNMRTVEIEESRLRGLPAKIICTDDVFCQGVSDVEEQEWS